MAENKEKKEIEPRNKEEISRAEGEPTRAGVFYTPLVDIFENDTEITVTADLPGVSQEKLDIDVRDNVLTLTGQVEEPDARFNPIYTEYGVGGYLRRFTLSNKIDQSKIKANLKDGVLTLSLPKSERLQPRKVNIATT